MSKHAVLRCCSLGHTAQPKTEWPEGRIQSIHWYEPTCRASITYCEIKAKACTKRGVCAGSCRFALAADKLRDFLTVRILTAELDAIEAQS